MTAPPRYPVAPKVAAGTGATAIVSILAAVATWIQGTPTALDALPNWLAGFLIALIPPALTLLAGYQAPHQDRPAPPAEEE
jgi:hypothetical protein